MVGAQFGNLNRGDAMNILNLVVIGAVIAITWVLFD